MAAVLRFLAAGLLVLGGVALGLWELWFLVVAFIGGRAPIPFTDWQIEGGFVSGVVFLLFGAPILTMAGYFIGMVTVVPIGAALNAIADRLDPAGATDF